MIIVVFIIAVVVSMPIAAIVLVSIASNREDRAFSLGRPANSRVKETARRILDFSTETKVGWSKPTRPRRLESVASASESGQPPAPRRPADIDSVRPMLATKIACRPAA